MKIKEIREKSDKELNKMLAELRDKLRDLNFKVVSKQIKNHREIRKLKRRTARILTILKERELIKEIKKGIKYGKE